MRLVGLMLVCLGISATAQAQTWQVCTWDVELTQNSRVWTDSDLVEKTRFDSGKVAAMEVDNERQGWEVKARFLRTNGRYTEPCVYMVGQEARMVVWSSHEHQDKMPPKGLVFQQGDVLTVTQHVREQDVAKKQLSGDEFELQQVELTRALYLQEVP